MLPTAYDITDKVVFMTGAGRGIGKGIAQVLAAAGADVVLNCTDAQVCRADCSRERQRHRPPRHAAAGPGQTLSLDGGLSL